LTVRAIAALVAAAPERSATRGLAQRVVGEHERDHRKQRRAGV